MSSWIFRQIYEIMYVRIIIVVIRDKVCRSHVIVGTPQAVHCWMTKLLVFEAQKITFLALDGGNILLDSQQSWENAIGIYM